MGAQGHACWPAAADAGRGKIGAAEDIKAAWAKNGADYGQLSQPQFAAMVQSEIQRWAHGQGGECED
jgi:hypothetical protein